MLWGLEIFSSEQTEKDQPSLSALQSWVDLSLAPEKYLKKAIPEPELSLKNICRESIRNHLLQMSNVNLFARVPKLPLPKALQSYLLYYQALQEEEEEEEIEDDDDDDSYDYDFNYDYNDHHHHSFDDDEYDEFHNYYDDDRSSS